MSYPPLTVDQKVALFDAMFGPSDAQHGLFSRFDAAGTRRYHLHARQTDGKVEFGPWTTAWNPDQYFDTVEAAVAWAEVEDWGAEPVKADATLDELMREWED